MNFEDVEMKELKTTKETNKDSLIVQTEAVDGKQNHNFKSLNESSEMKCLNESATAEGKPKTPSKTLKGQQSILKMFKKTEVVKKSAEKLVITPPADACKGEKAKKRLVIDNHEIDVPNKILKLNNQQNDEEASNSDSDDGIPLSAVKEKLKTEIEEKPEVNKAKQNKCELPNTKIEKEQKRIQREKEKFQKEQEKRNKAIQRELERAEREEKKKKKLEEQRLKMEEQRQKIEMKKEKIKQKEEQRRKEKEKKEVERLKREAERQKMKQRAQEERVKAAEEEKRIKEKRKTHFLGFFKPVAKPAADELNTSTLPSIGSFQAYQLKEGMWLAPTSRNLLNQETKSNLDQYLVNQMECGKDAKTRISQTIRHRSSKSLIPRNKRLNIHDDGIEIDADDDISKTRTKLLQFHENHRPPYYGTWRRRSSLISARNPWKLDKELLDYEFDSEEEWEEPVEGEDIVNSEGEEETAADDDDDDNDGFFVPHGYLSNDEGINDGDASDSEIKNDISDKRLKAKQIEFEKSFQVNVKVLSPICIGCYYDNEQLTTKSLQVLTSYQWNFLCDLPINLDKQKKDSSKSKEFPDRALPDLIRLLHGNPYSLHRICSEFQEYWDLYSAGSLPLDAGPLDPQDVNKPPTYPIRVINKYPLDSAAENNAKSSKATGVQVPSNHLISKGKLSRKIKEISVYGRKEQMNRSCWFVIDSVFNDLQLDRDSFPLPNLWGYITQVPDLRIEAVLLPASNPPEPPPPVEVDVETDKAQNPAANAEKPEPSAPMSKYIQKTDPVKLLEDSRKKLLKGQTVKSRRVPLQTVTMAKPAATLLQSQASVVETSIGFGMSNKKKADT